MIRIRQRFQKCAIACAYPDPISIWIAPLSVFSFLNISLGTLEAEAVAELP
jgi:hypothetical protein